MHKKELKKHLNLAFTDVTNKTFAVGKYDMPYVLCNPVDYPDYLALYDELKDYHKTENTGICFYLYDSIFDGIDGIYNAVYYNRTKWLNFYKERFKNVRFIITPDYSQCGDVNKIENLYRLFKARVISVWMATELHICVIPNITYTNRESFEYMLDGMEDCKVVAFSTKGMMKDEQQIALLKDAIKYTVDHIQLNAIIIYTVSTKLELVESIFQYASEKGVKLVLPGNSLRDRNLVLKGA